MLRNFGGGGAKLVPCYTIKLNVSQGGGKN